MMKIKYILLVGLLYVGAVSCSEDYLHYKPTESISEETVYETTHNAKSAVRGLYRLMKDHYESTQGWSGEGKIKMLYGNTMGTYMIEQKTGSPNSTNGTLIDRNNGQTNYFPWFYYYKIIGDANSLIAHIDDADGPENERQYIKAQGLSMRAYSYFMLTQLYGNRWIDTNNGDTSAVVLRLEPDNEPMPLSTLKEVYDQIYADLYDAIDLFEKSNYVREKNYEVDGSVAKAMLARTAITKQDYETAEKYAREARQGFPLMSVQEYFESGFANPNSEWIWSSDGTPDESTGFWYFHGYIGYNGSGSNVRTYPKRIYKPLFESIPDTDIRRELFLDPKDMDYNRNNGRANDELEAYARQRWPDIQSDARIYALMQFKFKANELPGAGFENHFRSSEMYLIEAEAKYFLKKEGEVQRLLEELTADSGRDPEYTCNKTGEDLLEEIKKYRAIELWAEGFDWFDAKRWGDSINRKSFDEGGNFAKNLAISYGPEDHNRWKWRVPKKELDNNPEIPLE